MIGTGTLIWVSLRPLIRLFLTVACGYAITKADLFPAIAASGAGQIILNITLPCLMFSKIVPAFNSSNISALGPLVLVALIYEVIGGLIAWIVSQIFWVPHRFRYGIIVAGAWGNYADIPTSVIMSITGAAPFTGDDQDLAVAYVAAFILVWFITLFPLGGHRLIARDFIGPDVEDDDVREKIDARRRRIMMTCERAVSWAGGALLRRPSGKTSDRSRENGEGSDLESSQMPAEKHVFESDMIEQTTTKTTVPIVEEILSATANSTPSSAAHSIPLFNARNSNVTSSSMTVVQNAPPHEPYSPSLSPALTSEREKEKFDPSHAPSNINQHSRTRSFLPSPSHFLRQMVEFLRSLLSPSSISIILALIISVVPDLQALFVPGVPGTSIPNAPDGQPPLAFALDTATFIGAASVPLGLICLGSAIARLQVPRIKLPGLRIKWWQRSEKQTSDSENTDREAGGEWRRMPLGAIAALAIGKMVLMPVLGVLICQGLTYAGVIARENLVLRYVCIFFACLPTATAQVYLTQVYSGTGTAQHLSPFLIPQYALMLLSMTVLTAYTLNLLFSNSS